ncbi:unnamed protein product [Heterobilharzia americana]|nr:unnamed protein product [Heterobilharzia americana]
MTIDQPQDNNNNNNNNNDIFITKFVPKSGEQEIEQSIEGKIQEIVCHVQVDEKLYTTDNYSDYQITDKPNNNNNNNSIDNKQYSQTSFDKTSIET